jgi:signal transduction histidine kinase
MRQKTMKGKEVVVSGRATLMRDRHGAPQSVLIINTDITEQKKLESQFLRAQRLESIGTLASGVAHDLNNILAPILMCAPLLRSELASEVRESFVSTIESSAQRGAEIVRQVLTFARGAEGERLAVSPFICSRRWVRSLRRLSRSLSWCALLTASASGRSKETRRSCTRCSSISV